MKETSWYIRAFFPWLLTFLSLILCDIAIYWSGPSSLQWHTGVYLLALVPSLLFWLFTYILYLRLPLLLRKAFAVGIGGFCGFLCVVSAFLYAELGMYLTLWMARVVGGESSNWSSYLQSYLSLKITVALVGLSCLFGLVWWPWQGLKISQKKPIGGLVALFCSLGACVGFLYIGVLFQSQKLPIDTSLFAAVFGQLGDEKRDEESGFFASERYQVPKNYHRIEPLDVVLVVNESWRRKGLPFYGARFDGMPRLHRWLRKNSASTFVFQRAFTNSMATELSLSSLLTSKEVFRSNRTFHRAPMLWDWLKSVQRKTFFVTSHKYSFIGGLPGFFQTEGLDRYLGQEQMKGPLVNDLGMDDLLAVRRFVKLLKNVPRTTRILGVFNTNAMHVPLQNTSSTLQKQPNTGERYKDALKILDLAMEQIILALQETGRYKNTLLILTSDHGETRPKSSQSKRLFNPHDNVIRIPLLMRVPPGWLKKHPIAQKKLTTNIHRNVANIDILPTILEVLGMTRFQKRWPNVLKRDGLPLTQDVPEDRFITVLNANGTIERLPKVAVLVHKKQRMLFGSSMKKTLNQENSSLKKNLWPTLSKKKRLMFESFIKKHKMLKKLYLKRK